MLSLPRHQFPKHLQLRSVSLEVKQSGPTSLVLTECESACLHFVSGYKYAPFIDISPLHCFEGLRPPTYSLPGTVIEMLESILPSVLVVRWWVLMSS